MDSSDIERILANCELFKGLGSGEIKNIANVCKVHKFEAGECVYQQGDFGEHLYIIAEGKVVLERSMTLGSRKGKVVIATLGKGRVFGCWSTVLNDSHIMMLTTFCQSPTKIIVLNGSDLRNLMIRDTRFGFNVIENLCFLLRERIQEAYGALEKI